MPEGAEYYAKEFSIMTIQMLTPIRLRHIFASFAPRKTIIFQCLIFLKVLFCPEPESAPKNDNL